MHRPTHHPAITRRAAIRRAAATAAIGVPGLAMAGEKTNSAGAVRLERQATGSEIWQVTTDEYPQSNIYCETPYCSADSRYFVYQRRNPKLSGNRCEFMVVELGTWRQHRLDVSVGLSGCAITPRGMFYYLKRSGERLDLMRADLSEGTPRKVFELPDGPWRSLGTVSTDGRYYVRSKTLDDKYSMFGIVLFDLERGTETIIDRDPLQPQRPSPVGARRRPAVDGAAQPGR